MQTPFCTSFYWVYYKLHISFLGIRSIGHSAIKPTALCPGLVLGPYFARLVLSELGIRQDSMWIGKNCTSFQKFL